MAATTPKFVNKTGATTKTPTPTNSTIKPKTHSSRKNIKRTVKIGDTKVEMTGLSRRQRKQIVEAVSAKYTGPSRAMFDKGIKGLVTIASTIEGMVTGLEAMGNTAEAQKMKAIKSTIDSFLESMQNMTPDQIEALIPILSKIPSSGKVNQSLPTDQQGTIIL